MVGPVGELAETTSLLRMRSRKITEGSNPSLSAIDSWLQIFQTCLVFFDFALVECIVFLLL